MRFLEKAHAHSGAQTRSYDAEVIRPRVRNTVAFEYSQAGRCKGLLKFFERPNRWRRPGHFIRRIHYNRNTSAGSARHTCCRSGSRRPNKLPPIQIFHKGVAFRYRSSDTGLQIPVEPTQYTRVDVELMLLLARTMWLPRVSHKFRFNAVALERSIQSC
jgi:hypothetical protein